VRNNIEVKNTEKLGSLPGEEVDKLLPFLMPIADHCGGVEA
jgi:predicted ribonuclease YlaK